MFIDDNAPIFTNATEPFADWDDYETTSVFVDSAEPFADWDETK